MQEFDDENVSPLQIIDPQHDRTRPRTSTKSFDDQREQDLSGLGGRYMVELGGVPEQMEHAFDESTEHRVVGLEAVQLDALGPTDIPQQLRWSVLIQIQPTEQRRRDRRPHIGLAVRGAGTREDGDGTTRKRVERLGHQPGLAGTGLAGDRHDRTPTVGNHRHDRREQLPLRRPPNERNVVEPGPDGGDATPTTGHLPHAFGLLASADVERVDRFAEDLLGRQRGSGIADQDAARPSQGLQPRRER